MTWNQKKIEELKKSGKIRGYVVKSKPKPGFSSGRTEQRSRKSKGLDWLEMNIAYWCNEKSLSLEKEHRFCQDRSWRFDFAIPSLKLAVEFEGGVFYHNSGHKTAKHYTKDTEKYNRAASMGWKVLRYTALNYSTAINDLNNILRTHGATS